MAINSSKVDEEQKEVLKSATIRRLFSYLKNYKRQVAVVLVVLAVTIAISTVNPLLLEYAIDVNIAQKDWRGLVALCVFMVVINLVYAAGVRLRMLLMARITNNILLEIRDELYTHIQTLSFSFFDTRPAGKILARIIGDVNSLKDVLNDGVTKLIPNILTIIAILALLKCDSRAAADRCRHVFYSDRRTQEMADVPEKIFQCYGVYPRGLLRYPHHQELYRRAGIAGRV